MEKTTLEKEFMRDEIRSLKAEARSYQKELEASSPKRTVNELETIGKEVRMRYLELHRRRMGRRTGDASLSHIKSGDRAAHRGRPLADARLYQNGDRSDPDVYENLYGITPKIMQKWRDIAAVVEIAGFRASLQSEGLVSDKFQRLFDQFLGRIEAYPSSTNLREAFMDDMALQREQHDLQACYDEIIASQPLGGRRNQPAKVEDLPVRKKP
jgi:hypothetical protein